MKKNELTHAIHEGNINYCTLNIHSTNSIKQTTCKYHVLNKTKFWGVTKHRTARTETPHRAHRHAAQHSEAWRTWGNAV